MCQQCCHELLLHRHCPSSTQQTGAIPVLLQGLAGVFELYMCCDSCTYDACFEHEWKEIRAEIVDIVFLGFLVLIDFTPFVCTAKAETVAIHSSFLSTNRAIPTRQQCSEVSNVMRGSVDIDAVTGKID